MSEILPSSTGLSFAKEARDLLIDLCVEFISLVSSEANEISEKESKKTIACDHITQALERLGFADYVPAVLEAAAEHKEVQKVLRTVNHLPVHFCLFFFSFSEANTSFKKIGTREESQQVRAVRPLTRRTRADPTRAVC